MQRNPRRLHPSDNLPRQQTVVYAVGVERFDRTSQTIRQKGISQNTFWFISPCLSDAFESVSGVKSDAFRRRFPTSTQKFTPEIDYWALGHSTAREESKSAHKLIAPTTPSFTLDVTHPENGEQTVCVVYLASCYNR